jgi:hypothetical protein
MTASAYGAVLMTASGLFLFDFNTNRHRRHWSEIVKICICLPLMEINWKIWFSLQSGFQRPFEAENYNLFFKGKMLKLKQSSLGLLYLFSPGRGGKDNRHR